MGRMPIADRMTPPCCPARAVAAVIPGGSTLREVSAGTPPGTLDTYGPLDRFTQTVKTGQTSTDAITSADTSGCRLTCGGGQPRAAMQGGLGRPA